MISSITPLPLLNSRFSRILRGIIFGAKLRKLELIESATERLNKRKYLSFRTDLTPIKKTTFTLLNYSLSYLTQRLMFDIDCTGSILTKCVTLYVHLIILWLKLHHIFARYIALRTVTWHVNIFRAI